MGLAALKEALPGFAKDLKLNLGSVIGGSTLPAQRLWGAVLVSAIAARGSRTLAELDAEAREHLSEQAYQAARAAAAVMAMNNVYYRSLHLIEDEQYATMPARLRMSVIANPGVPRADFELWSLTASAVNGCGRCLQAHERELREAGEPREVIQEALRIAAVVSAVAVTLEGDDVLTPA